MSGLNVVKCFDEECECLARVLKKFGVLFTYDFWEATMFTLAIDRDALAIQAWHDAGSSTVKIPLSLLKDELASELIQCGLLKEVQEG